MKAKKASILSKLEGSIDFEAFLSNSFVRSFITSFDKWSEDMSERDKGALLLKSFLEIKKIADEKSKTKRDRG